MNTVQQLKADGRYYHAGALDAARGGEGNYGCHYGMRSTKEAAQAEYWRGYQDACRDIACSNNS